MKNLEKTAKILSISAMLMGVFVGVLVFIFALLSGSEAYGGGFMGILKNSPNALPWLVFLATIWLAWKWPLLGGILLNILGIFSLFFFVFSSPVFHWPVFVLSIIIMSIGCLFLASWYLSANKKKP
ncbi:MAG: hypothetical protein B7C24_09705 [Bacteroidetes bacterium 4572_77]|nr:MAG: hypothetical protein B7C24_09705 [Bacteroidetes bacterium 4572_77]